MPARISNSRVYETIVAIQQASGLPPNRREVAQAVGMSLNWVNNQVDKLVRAGLLTRIRYSPRAIGIPKHRLRDIKHDGTETTSTLVGAEKVKGNFWILSYRRDR